MSAEETVRVHFEGGGFRDSNEDKPRFDLLILQHIPYHEQPLTRVAQLMADGAKHYEPRNHENMRSKEAYERCQASAFRHLVAWIAGQDDEDHGAAMVANFVMAEGIKYRMEHDGCHQE